jgi:hypothetical protein
MMDETTPAPAPTSPVEDVFPFPQDVVEKWIAIPGDQRVIGPLTKDDLDHLLFSTSRIASSVAALHRGLVAYSHGRVEEANAALAEAANSNIEGETHMRKLFFAIMQSIVTKVPDAPEASEDAPEASEHASEVAEGASEAAEHISEAAEGASETAEDALETSEAAPEASEDDLRGE